MGNSSNAIRDSNDAPIFGDIRPDATDLMDLPDVEVDDKEADGPDASLIDKPRRKPSAVKYEKKTRGLFNTAFHLTVRQQKTLPDAATILMYGPDVSEALGDLAAENEWVAKSIDMLTDTTENAALSLILVAVPFIAQIVRNHEPSAEVEGPRTIRIPFIKRQFRVRFNLKFRRLRKFSHEPSALTSHVFSQPAVVEKLKKQGITVVQR